MVRMQRTIPVLTMLLLTLAFATSSARAATITQTDSCNIISNNDLCQTTSTDLLATASLSLNDVTNAFSLTYTLQNFNTTNSATLSAFTLQLFDSGFTINSADTTGVPSGWQVVAGAKEDNSLTKFVCNNTGKGLAGWLCVSDTAASGATTGPLTVGALSTLTFTFDGTLDAGNHMVTPFDLMTKGIYTDGVKYAISSSMVTPGGPPPHQIPEPASLLVLGCGLLGLSTLLRRRRNS